MKKLIQKAKTLFLTNTHNNGQFRTIEQKTKAGIDFTIERYGKTLTDLARYDKGEKFSN